MKCPNCNTHKEMGTSMARIDDFTAVETWLCCPCGCNMIKRNIPRSTELRKDSQFLFQEDKKIEFDESGIYPKGITNEQKQSAMESAMRSTIRAAALMKDEYRCNII